jgi:stage II sporulation protein M
MSQDDRRETSASGTAAASRAIGFLFSQNSRVLLVSTALGAVTFGVVALALNPLTLVILGYVTGQLFLTGNDPGIVLAAILPHGMVEIPIILIATAAALRLGAVITKLPRGKTVGQAWIEALGETIKIGIGVILPGLIIAALLEGLVTVRIVAWYLGG